MYIFFCNAHISYIPQLLAALHALKRYNDAIAAYEDGITKFPDNAALKKGLEQVKRDKDGPPPGPGARGGGGGIGSSCTACGSKGPMSQRPMAACAEGKGMCISCSQKMDNVQSIVRGMMQKSGIGNKKVSDDDPLFQDPPPKEDCPICMLPMPVNSGICDVHTTYQSCCGKIICNGCVHAARQEIEKGKMKDVCPFCRVPNPRSEKEEVKRINARVKLNDAAAFLRLGNGYGYTLWGLPLDRNKAFELYKRGAELGSIEAHDQISKAYKNGFGEGIKWDMDKAQYHMEMAAKGGHEVARHNLGLINKSFYGSSDRVMKHFMISASAGFEKSLKEVGEGYKAGHVTKDEYAKTLHAYQNTREEMKSVQRAKVAALIPTTDRYV